MTARCFALLGSLAFAASAAAYTPTAPLAWDFDGRAVPGVVRVMPVVAPVTNVETSVDTWVGAGLDAFRQAARHEREGMLHHVPGAIATALPGAINGLVGASWGGFFTVGHYPVGGRRRVANDLGSIALPATLSDIARRDDRAGTLFVWVEAFDATPLSAETFAGDIVSTQVGPVVVDHDIEPYRVTATVGAALIASDGEIVVRYVDHFEAVLTDRGPAATGRQIAQDLARELSLVWPSDPRLQDSYALLH